MDMSCDAGFEADRPLFRNAEWTVTADGLEHGRTGYFIERGLLASRRSDGLWAWPLHMAEKSWLVREAFAEAFAAGVRAFGLGADEALALTFREAGLAPAGPAQAEPRNAARRSVEAGRVKVRGTAEPKRRSGSTRDAAQVAKARGNAR